MNDTLLRLLLRLHPKDWRARYATEVRSLVSHLVQTGDTRPYRAYCDLMGSIGLSWFRRLKGNRASMLAGAALSATMIAVLLANLFGASPFSLNGDASGVSAGPTGALPGSSSAAPTLSDAAQFASLSPAHRSQLLAAAAQTGPSPLPPAPGSPTAAWASWSSAIGSYDASIPWANISHLSGCSLDSANVSVMHSDVPGVPSGVGIPVTSLSGRCPAGISVFDVWGYAISRSHESGAATTAVIG